MKEFRILGPPGTGKTKRLTEQSIPAAVDRFGADKVLVMSFTRAAAKEIASRQHSIPPENVGTIHALCYRALGNPTIAETRVSEFNSECPAFAISGVSSATTGLDENPEITLKDDALSEYNRLRGALIPSSMHRASIQLFAKRWDQWKQDHGYKDFADLLEESLDRLPYPPNNARCIFVDEAQDCNPLQLKLIRKWGMHTDYIVLVGDDDQTLYSFTGASPQSFLSPIDNKMQTVLDQSYRVPRKVHTVAMRIASRIKRRQPKTYYPRNADGVAGIIRGDYKATGWVVNKAIELADAGETVMILGTCAYHLKYAINELRQRKMPFWNPYRQTDSTWNPIRKSKKHVTSSDLILSFLSSGGDENYWSIPQLVKWCSALKTTCVLNGKVGKTALETLKQAIEDQLPGLHTSREVLSQVLSQEAIEPALARDLDWFTERLPKSRRGKNTQFAIDIAKKRGASALEEPPKIIVGTIHSVKGGEADNVILFPDISSLAYDGMMRSQDGYDALARVFYVGVTRARKGLFLTMPATKLAFDIPGWN